MKRLFAILLMSLFAASSLLLHAQENDQVRRDRVKVLQEHYNQVLDFSPNGFEAGHSATYEILNHKSIYFDVSRIDLTATLYFNYHAVYQFEVQFPDSDTDGPIVLLDGKGDNGIAINREAECMSVLHADGSIHEVSGVTVQKIPGMKLRIVPGNLDDFKFRLHNELGTFRADFYIRDFLTFGFDAGLVLEATEGSTCDVWDLIGNSHSRLSFNPESKMLFFREGSPTGNWAMVKKERLTQ